MHIAVGAVLPDQKAAMLDPSLASLVAVDDVTSILHNLRHHVSFHCTSALDTIKFEE